MFGYGAVSPGRFLYFDWIVFVWVFRVCTVWEFVSGDIFKMVV